MNFDIGIHETALNISNTLAIALSASGDIAEVRMSEVYAVNTPVQYIIKSRTLNEMEAGWGIVSAANELTRSNPTRTYNGTTFDKSPSAKLAFSAATVDVYIHPHRDSFVPPYPGSLENLTSNATTFKLQEVTDHISATSAFATSTQTIDRLYLLPFLKKTHRRASGLFCFGDIGNPSGVNTYGGIIQVAPDGSFGTVLAETTNWTWSGVGLTTKLFASAVDMPAGWYWIYYISDVATQLRSRFASQRQTFGWRFESTTSSYTSLYKDIVNSGNPAIPTDATPTTSVSGWPELGVLVL